MTLRFIILISTIQFFIFHDSVNATSPDETTLDRMIVNSLQEHWVVAIGENHGHLALHNKIIESLAKPQVGLIVDDIVVEFGNSLYQSVIDKYIDGEDISYSLVQPAFRNTVVSPNTVWDSPIYADFFKKIRNLNQTRQDGRKYRVVLGDTAVDWSLVKSRKDLIPFYNRSKSIYEKVKTEVLKKGRRAILVAGGAHLTRRNMTHKNKHGVTWAEVSVVSRLELFYPNAVFVIRSLGKGRGLDHQKFVDTSLGSILLTKDPRVANVSANAMSTMKNMDGTPFDAYGDATLSDIVDAVIYWGAETVEQFVEPTNEVYLDDDYWNELNRRSILLRKKAMDPSLRE